MAVERKTSDVIEVFVERTVSSLYNTANTRSKESRALREACKKYLDHVKQASADGTLKSTSDRDAQRGVLSLQEAMLTVEPLHLACATQQPKLVEQAVDCLHKLIAHGYLHVDTRSSPSQLEPSSDAEPTSNPSLDLASLVVKSICQGAESNHAGVQLAVLKALLTAATSSHFRLHGDCLLQAVRVCYSLALASTTEANQAVARNALLQIVTMTFKRMDADTPESSKVSHYPLPIATPSKGDAPPASPDSSSIEAGAEAAPTAAELTSLADSQDISSLEAVLEKTRSGGLVQTRSAEIATTDSTANEGDSAEDAAESSTVNGDMNMALEESDAVLVLRVLCRLSGQRKDDNVEDPFLQEGKLVCLNLLVVILESVSARSRENAQFVLALRQHLCLALLRNCLSPVPAVFRLVCAIFNTMVLQFRTTLKGELGVFFPLVALRPLEQSTWKRDTHQHVTSLRMLRQLCQNPQVLVDLFVNYDCDLEAANLYERMLLSLAQVVQGLPARDMDSPAGTAPPPNAAKPAAAQPPAVPVPGAVRLGALQCLLAAMKSLLWWASKDDGSGTRRRAESVQTNPEDLALPGIDESQEANGEGGEGEQSEVQLFEAQKAHKVTLSQGIAAFNKNPIKGVRLLQSSGVVGESPEEVARFLQSTPGLDKTQIGELLGHHEDRELSYMQAYAEMMELSGMRFDDALRHFLGGFRLPGEAQKIDRLMEAFSARFHALNPGTFVKPDSAYILAYAVVMLNTDQHHEFVDDRMSRTDFITMNSCAFDEAENIDSEFLGGIFDRIVANEIELKDEGAVDKGKGGDAEKESKGRARLAKLLRKGMPQWSKKAAATRASQESEALLRRTRALFSRSASNRAVYYEASHPAHARPMLEAVGWQVLAAYSTAFDTTEDMGRAEQCLEGMSILIRLAVLVSMETLRDATLACLAGATRVDAPSHMQTKHAKALEFLFQLAGSHPHVILGSWRHVLQCASRVDHLRLTAERAASDAALFPSNAKQPAPLKTPASPPTASFASFMDSLAPGVFSATMMLRRKLSPEAADPGPAPASEPPVPRSPQRDTVAMGAADGDVGRRGLPPEVVEQISAWFERGAGGEGVGQAQSSLERIYAASAELDADNAVLFAQALCEVSWEELHPQTPGASPSIFSLQKLVEVAHFNLNRIRMIRSRVWPILSSHLIDSATHPNTSVGLYAVDSLRQLTYKVLDRAPLEHGNYQAETLKPFAVLMGRTANEQVRELIVHCVSQLVQGHASTLGPGYQSVFQVYESAGSDSAEKVIAAANEAALAALPTLFTHIPPDCFPDCLAALVAFAANQHHPRISLQAVGALVTCANSLAQACSGTISPSASPAAAEAFTPTSPRLAEPAAPSAADVDSYWLALTVALAKLVGDPRASITTAAVNSLFHLLHAHAQSFSPALWQDVADKALLSLFLRPAASAPQGEGAEAPASPSSAPATPTPPAEDPLDRLEQQHKMCIPLLCDLFAAQLSCMRFLLPWLLDLISGFVCLDLEDLEEPRCHATACTALRTLQGFLCSAAEHFTPAEWSAIVAALDQMSSSTCPLVLLQGAEGAGAAGRRAAASAAVAHALVQQAVAHVHSAAGPRLAAPQQAALLDTLRRSIDAAAAWNTDPALSGPRSTLCPSAPLGKDLDSAVALPPSEALDLAPPPTDPFARPVCPTDPLPASPRSPHSDGNSGRAPDGPLSLGNLYIHEVEGSVLYLETMMRWQATQQEGNGDVGAACTRLVEFCQATLQRALEQETHTLEGARHGAHAHDLSTKRWVPISFRAPALAAAVRALTGVPPGILETSLPSMYPMFVLLISHPHPQVRIAIRGLLHKCVGTKFGLAAPRSSLK